MFEDEPQFIPTPGVRFPPLVPSPPGSAASSASNFELTELSPSTFFEAVDQYGLGLVLILAMAVIIVVQWREIRSLNREIRAILKDTTATISTNTAAFQTFTELEKSRRRR